MQNVGAYGQEVAETITRVDAYDRSSASVRELTPADCRFGYRDSLFKHTDRYVVIRVGVRAHRERQVRPAAVRGAGPGRSARSRRWPTCARRCSGLRRGKGMVVDAADPDTWSAGSFFTNPVLRPGGRWPRSRRGSTPGTAYPSWPAAGGRKLSAAWLIERAGFAKGYGAGAVRISSKHTLALTHRGGGSAARPGRAGPRGPRRGRGPFGVELRPEPRLVGVAL